MCLLQWRSTQQQRTTPNPPHHLFYLRREILSLNLLRFQGSHRPLPLQGKCKEDPKLAPPAGTAVLRDFLPDQCMLLADVDLLKVKESKLWVDQLYVRFIKSSRQPATWSKLAEGQFFHFIDVQVLPPQRTLKLVDPQQHLLHLSTL